MAARQSLKFAVRRSQEELIIPSKPTPRELKTLSDIDDQEGLRFQISFIMFYNGSSLMKEKDPVKIIREALSEALVFYYPFAGRIVEGPNNKLMVDCNAQGCLFIEADADITLEQLGDSIQPPCPCIDQLLFDVPGSSGIIGSPLMLIQVTRLACGGFILATRINHCMTDSVGLAKFLKAMTEIAKGAKIPSISPVWQREILSARNPPQVTHTHQEYDQINHISNKSILKFDNPNIVQRSFFFSPKDIKTLRNQLPTHLKNSSTFEILSACIWKCRSIAFGLDSDEVVRLSCITNITRSMELPNGYYGNSFVLPAVVSKAGLLSKNPLGYGVQLVKKLKSKLSEEYIKSSIDLINLNEGLHYTTVWNFVLTDTSHVGLADVDFGWGKPRYHGPTGSFPYIGIFSRFRNSNGENGFVIPVWLPRDVMEKFEDEFLKMTGKSASNSFDAMMPKIISSL